MTFLRPGTGAWVSALGSTYTTKTDGEGTGGAYALIEEEFWGDPTPVHVHTAAEEAFYVLSGRVAVLVGGEEAEAVPGTFVVVPRRTPHGLRRLTDEPVRMLTLVSPPGFERFLDAVADIGEETLLADPERLLALAREYDTEIVGE